MKVLVAHNRYRSDVPSGENIVVDTEIELLRRGGRLAQGHACLLPDTLRCGQQSQ